MFLPATVNQPASATPVSVPTAMYAAATAPATVPVGSRITVRANGLEPGRYTLQLVQIVAAPTTTAATGCSGRIGSATATASGRVTITGALPTRLACRTGAGPVEGQIMAAPGHDLLELGVIVPPGIFGQGSFVRQPILVTAT